jgi:hypothetical protein
VTGQIYTEYVFLPIDPDADWKKFKRLPRIRPQPTDLGKWLKHNYEYQLEFSTEHEESEVQGALLPDVQIQEKEMPCLDQRQ